MREMIDDIHERGWTVSQVALKDHEYVATGDNGVGDKIDASGPTEASAVGQLLMRIMRRETVRTGHVKESQWGYDFSNMMEEIAKAYAAAPVYDINAAPAWKELGVDSTRRAEVLKEQLKVEYTPDPAPYMSAAEMCEDVHNNRHIFVATSNSSHPVWDTQTNADFRLVHDVLGHCQSGGSFGWEGELAACAYHAPLLTATAQKALFTECIAQTGAAIYFRSFFPQKVAFLDDYIGPAQEQENDPWHQGVHPSQTVAPTEMPSIQERESPGLSWATQIPNPDFTGGIPVFGKNISSTSPLRHFAMRKVASADPNLGWESQAQVLPTAAYLFEDPVGHEEMKDLAYSLDTGWQNLKNPDGSPNYEGMKDAIMNALRAAILSPQKELRANAIHYQDLMEVPYSEQNPMRYWEVLENKRNSWNSQRFYREESHRPYAQELEQLKIIERARHPELPPEEIEKRIGNELFQMRLEEEEKVLEELTAEGKNFDALDIDRSVDKAIAERLKRAVKPQEEEADFPFAEVEQLQLMAAAPSLNPNQRDLLDQPPNKYPAFMGTHLRSIAQLASHADELLDAALTDVHEYGGTGHHFRSKLIDLNVSGVGPKVASLAWLLLQPNTSQLATIDTHMMDVLGRDYNAEMSNRDFYKFERELQTGRDAAGYNHMPLGQFQWGMWDMKRSGEGQHQRHDPLKPIDPQPHAEATWLPQIDPKATWQPPEWWEATQEERDRVAQEWEENVATEFPKNRHPVFTSYRKWRNSQTEEAPIYPWVVSNGRIFFGRPEETYMQVAATNLGLSPQDVWAQLQTPTFAIGTLEPVSATIFSPERITRELEGQIEQAFELQVS